ncbi:MAG: hypothetical protein IPN94_17445 [Sphingobacteriales bacterium]|nr:hypothetical protein [Sphingobacteriales bacterium]
MGGTLDNTFGGHTLIDWSNPNVVYSRFNADLKKSIDGGNCFSANVSNTSSLGGEFDGLKDFLLAQDLQNPNWLYLAKINNFRKIDASTNTNFILTTKLLVKTFMERGASCGK